MRTDDAPRRNLIINTGCGCLILHTSESHNKKPHMLVLLGGRLFMYQEMKTKPDSVLPSIDLRKCLSTEALYIPPLEMSGSRGPPPGL